MCPVKEGTEIFSLKSFHCKCPLNHFYWSLDLRDMAFCFGTSTKGGENRTGINPLGIYPYLQVSLRCVKETTEKEDRAVSHNARIWFDYIWWTSFEELFSQLCTYCRHIIKITSYQSVISYQHFHSIILYHFSWYNKVLCSLAPCISWHL